MLSFCVSEDNMVATKWPLARIAELHVGQEGVARIVTLKTHIGMYARPVTKIVTLVPYNQAGT